LLTTEIQFKIVDTKQKEAANIIPFISKDYRVAAGTYSTLFQSRKQMQKNPSPKHLHFQ